jgi:hypothetical protein
MKVKIFNKFYQDGYWYVDCYIYDENSGHSSQEVVPLPEDASDDDITSYLSELYK